MTERSRQLADRIKALTEVARRSDTFNRRLEYGVYLIWLGAITHLWITDALTAKTLTATMIAGGGARLLVLQAIGRVYARRLRARVDLQVPRT